MSTAFLVGLWTFLVIVHGSIAGPENNVCQRRTLIESCRLGTREQWTLKETLPTTKWSKRKLLEPVPPKLMKKKGEKDTKPSEPRMYARLPELRPTQVNDEKIVELTEGYYAKVRTLSTVPPIFEIDSFLDEEECDLMIAYAKHKGQKLVEDKEWASFVQGSPEAVFQEWDYNEDGVIDVDEIFLAPGKSDINFTKEDADDMIFLLKMDKDGDGTVSIEELRNTDLLEVKRHVSKLREKEELRRNLTTGTTWLWHDKDDLLRFGDEYFYNYHNRIQEVTRLPEEIIKESEAIQVQSFREGNFQLCRHDSEYVVDNIPCCLFGDRSNCRLCRYISMVVFLNDVQEGGELAFPLANTSYQDVMDNPGEWRGYFSYAKTTGSKTQFTVNLKFSFSGVNRLVHGEGSDDVGAFELVEGVIAGETIRFEKRYIDQEPGENIKYAGKIVSGAKIYGKWWIPGKNRLQGEFFMWSKSYQIFSKNATDSCNIQSKCPKANLVVRPIKGKAVFWYNHFRDERTGMVGQLIKEAMVGHCEVTKGEKWIANVWLNVVGDGVKELRAWRRGMNWMSNAKQFAKVSKIMGTTKPPLPIDIYEEEYERDMMKGDQNFNRTIQDVDSYRTAKAQIKNNHILNAVTSLLNVIDEDGLKTIAGAVHSKLSLTCIPLVMEQDGRLSLGEGRG